MKKKIKRVGTILFVIILIAIITMVLIIFVQQKILKRKYINLFGYSIFSVETGSMSGTIEQNDIILVKITKDVDVYDIISFEQNNAIITHRIIEATDENLVTKGDANNTEDEPITRDAVIGKVIKSFSNAGIWIKVFSDKKVLISVLTTLILFAVILSFDKENKNE